jgi:hypothetical protein
VPSRPSAIPAQCHPGPVPCGPVPRCGSRSRNESTCAHTVAGAGQRAAHAPLARPRQLRARRARVPRAAAPGPAGTCARGRRRRGRAGRCGPCCPTSRTTPRRRAEARPTAVRVPPKGLRRRPRARPSARARGTCGTRASARPPPAPERELDARPAPAQGCAQSRCRCGMGRPVSAQMWHKERAESRRRHGVGVSPAKPACLRGRVKVDARQPVAHRAREPPVDLRRKRVTRPTAIRAGVCRRRRKPEAGALCDAP